jgi:hypothetical protein
MVFEQQQSLMNNLPDYLPVCQFHFAQWIPPLPAYIIINSQPLLPPRQAGGRC